MFLFSLWHWNKAVIYAAEIGKKVYALMVEKKSVVIPMSSGQPLYLQRYTMDNFTVTYVWIFNLFRDFIGL